MAWMAASVSAYAVRRSRFAWGKGLLRCDQELGAGHLRHPLIDQEDGDGSRSVLSSRTVSSPFGPEAAAITW